MYFCGADGVTPKAGLAQQSQKNLSGDCSANIWRHDVRLLGGTVYPFRLDFRDIWIDTHGNRATGCILVG